jgi:hypothetical protein
MRTLALRREYAKRGSGGRAARRATAAVLRLARGLGHQAAFTKGIIRYMNSVMMRALKLLFIVR